MDKNGQSVPRFNSVPRLNEVGALGPSLLQVYAGRAGRVKFNLSIGQPSLPPPSSLLNDVRDELGIKGFTDYTPAGGGKRAIMAVADFMSQRLTYRVFPEDVVISHGAKTIIDAVMRTVCRYQDPVVWFAPGYTYGRTAELNHLESYPINGRAPDFDPDFDQLAEQLNFLSFDRGFALVIINNPVNPTGRVWPRETLNQLAQIISSHNVVVLADETYAGLVYKDFDNEFVHFSNLPNMADRTVTIMSGSKDLRIPGFRFGYAVGPVEIMNRVRTILGDCVGCPNSFAQLAAQGLKYWSVIAREQMTSLQSKREIIGNWCRRHNLPVTAMEGAFYAFVDFNLILAKMELSDTCQLADFLMDKLNVGIIPGAAFGGESFKNWARLSYAGPQDLLEEGLRRIGQLLIL